MKEYMDKNRSRIFVMGLFVFLIHGAKLNSNILGIDTEDLIQYQDEFYGGWLETGRQGLVFLKQRMGNLSYNPYFSGLLTLLCFVAAVSAFLLLWDGMIREEKHSMTAWAACGLLWISHPIMTEQFYFTLQSAEVCIAIFLTAIALCLTRIWEQAVMKDGWQTPKVLWLLPLAGILVLLVTFSVYQVMVVFYIFGAVTLVLLSGISEVITEKSCNIIKLWQRIVPYVAVFLVAFVANSAITSLFFQSSDYLGNQIQWGKSGGISENLRMIAGHTVKTLTGYDSIYYNIGYGILCVVVLIAMLMLLVGSKVRKGAALTLVLFLLALFSTPYLMTIVIGGTPVVRSQLVLPAATGFLAYLAIFLWRELRALYGCDISVADGTASNKKSILVLLFSGILVGCIIGAWQQTQTTMQLYYTDSMRYEHDVAIARELMQTIGDKYEDQDIALVVVGSKPFVGNNSCIQGETIGVSFFDYDVELEPECYWSTRRVLGLFHLLGADYEIAPEDRFEGAIEYSEYMDAWPDKDCVKEQDGVVIIKMSEME